MLPLSALELALSLLIATAAAWLQGSIGFGMAMVAAPLLVLFAPELIPGPLIGSALALTLLVAHRERRFIDVPGVTWAAVGCLPGAGIAAWVLTVVTATGFGILFSILVLVAVLVSALGRSVYPSNRNALVAGFLSGFMGTTSSIGGPTVALVYQNERGPILRGTLSAYFSVASVIALTALAIAGEFGGTEIALAGLMLPASLAGFAISSKTKGVLDKHSLRPVVLVLSAGAAIAVLVRNIV